MARMECELNRGNTSQWLFRYLQRTNLPRRRDSNVSFNRYIDSAKWQCMTCMNFGAALVVRQSREMCADYSSHQPPYDLPSEVSGNINHLHQPAIEPPTIRSPPCLEPAFYRHVGSISTAFGSHRRRCGSQCYQQDCFGTIPHALLFPTTSPSSNNPISRNYSFLGASPTSIDLTTNQLTCAALGIYL